MSGYRKESRRRLLEIAVTEEGLRKDAYLKLAQEAGGISQRAVEKWMTALLRELAQAELEREAAAIAAPPTASPSPSAGHSGFDRYAKRRQVEDLEAALKSAMNIGDEARARELFAEIEKLNPAAAIRLMQGWDPPTPTKFVGSS